MPYWFRLGFVIPSGLGELKDRVMVHTNPDSSKGPWTHDSAMVSKNVSGQNSEDGNQ